MINKKLFLIPKSISNPRIRLFCFPFAGGAANTYYPWADKFNDQTELVLVQPPGRGPRIVEQPHDSMDSLVNELMQNSKFITSKPYVFFGHSLGSRVAYELCCQLSRAGMPLPKYFIASGSRAPHIPKKESSIYELPDNEFIQELRNLNGTPKEVLSNRELMAILIPLLRSDFKISDSYQADRMRMPFPILVLYGENDTDINHDDLVAWGELSSIDHKLIKFPGDHFFINQCSNQVVAQVSLVLNKLLSRDSSHFYTA